MPDMHMFLTPKPGIPPIFCKHVDVRDHSYLVNEDGSVLSQQGCEFQPIPRLSPAASEARKATGWFQ